MFCVNTINRGSLEISFIGLCLMIIDVKDIGKNTYSVHYVWKVNTCLLDGVWHLQTADCRLYLSLSSTQISLNTSQVSLNSAQISVFMVALSSGNRISK